MTESEGSPADRRSQADKDARLREHRLLHDNVPLLLRHQERIRAEPRLAAVTHPCVMLSAAWIGDGFLPIGALLELWEKDRWTSACPTCAGRVLITFVGGSVLSGDHAWTGVCEVCGDSVSYRSGPGSRDLPHATFFPTLWKVAQPLHRVYPWEARGTGSLPRGSDARG